MRPTASESAPATAGGCCARRTPRTSSSRVPRRRTTRASSAWSRRSTINWPSQACGAKRRCINMTDLTRALRLYLCRDTSAFPEENPAAVIDEFGPVHGPALNSEIDTLLREMDVLEPTWANHSLQSATHWAESEMHRRHPELEPEAIADLGWAWSFWNK